MLNVQTTHPLGDARARRLEEIVIQLYARTTRAADMADGAFTAMIRRMAMHQLIDEELQLRLPFTSRTSQSLSSPDVTMHPASTTTDRR